MLNTLEKNAQPYFISRVMKYMTTLRYHFTIFRGTEVKVFVLVIYCSVTNTNVAA